MRARGHERPADRGWSLLATLDSDQPSRIDGGGLITPFGAQWSLDWWIGADNRWHFPAREAAVRQRRRGGSVIETAVRIPSGDALHIAYAALIGGTEVVVVEVANHSPVPVALALAVRPYAVEGAQGEGPTPSIGIDRSADHGAYLIDHHALILPRPANQATASASIDLIERLVAGEELTWTGEVCGSGANAVLLYPLPHRTSLRFLIVPRSILDETRSRSASPTGSVPVLSTASVPDADSVARGWRSILAAATEVTLPDPGLADLSEAARTRLLMAPGELTAMMAGRPDGTDGPDDDADGDVGVVLAALGYTGHWSALTGALNQVIASFPMGGGAAQAASLAAGVGIGARLLLSRPPGRVGGGAGGRGGPTAAVELGRDLLEPLTYLTKLADRTGSRSERREALLGLALLAEALGQREAAEGLWERIGGGWLIPQRWMDDLASLTERAQTAASVGRWNGSTWISGFGSLGDSRAKAARYLVGARSMLVREAITGWPALGSTAELAGPSPIVEILPGFPVGWRGGSLQVHHLPTVHGWLSFALRWHGARPALLWEIEPGPRGGPGHGATMRLICPSLDPAWISDGDRGEALLAGSARGLADIPGPGDSFG